MSKNDYTPEAHAYLRSQGLNVGTISFDGKNQRCSTKDKPDSKNGAYKAFIERDIPVVFWKNWRTNDSGVWTSMSTEKLSRPQQRAIERRIKKEEKAVAKRQAKAAERAERLISKAKKRRTHPYLRNKGVNFVSGLMVDDNGGLLVTARNEHGVLTTLQRIDDEGNKQFLPDGKISGSFFLIGKIEGVGIILVAEGLATALSLHESTGYPVLVAFFASNLVHVAKIARTFAPDAKIILCADNDIRDKDSNAPNTGVQYSTIAALEVEGWLTVPHLECEGLPVKCDFNDVHKHKGAKTVKKQIAHAERPAGHLTKKDTLPSGYFIRWTGKQSGLWFTDSKKAEQPQDIYLGPVIHVLALTRNDDNENWGLLLEWFDLDGKRHTWAMPKSLLVNDLAASWLIRIVDGGWSGPVYSKVRALLGAYLLSYRISRRAICVPRTGWHGGVYVLPDCVIGECENELMVLQAPVADNPFAVGGTFKGWRNTIGKWSKNNSRLVLGISTALASALLSLMGLESGGFNFVGESSKGKTTCLRVAGSCCGKGTLGDGGFLNTWRSTANGLEGVAELHSDALLCLDEIGQASGKTIAEAVYMLANSKGKIRATQSGNARKAKSWRIMFLTTGEKGVSEAIEEEGGRARAGQLVRLVDIPSYAGAEMGLFEDLHGHESPAVFADALHAAAAKNYGHVFRAFITMVQKNPGEVKARFGQGLPEYLERLCGPNADGQVRRVAKRFHVCAVAGELATEWRLLPWKKGEASRAIKKCFRAWLRQRGGKGSTEDAEIISKITMFIQQHGSSRFQDLAQPDDKCFNRVGFKRRAGEKMEYILPSETFQKEVCRGMDYKRAVKLLDRKGLLSRDKDRPMKKVDIPGLGRKYCYIIAFKDKHIEDVPAD